MNELNDILARYFAEEANADDTQKVEAWKAWNPEEFEALQKSWSSIDNDLIADLEFKTFDKKAAWNKVEPSLNPEQETRVIRLQFYKKVAAACAILLIGLGAFWYLNGTSTMVITNDTAGQKELNLPDGSQVWLAENTRLEYNSDFNDDRTLKLEGEAFFEVTKDPDHPFVVHTTHGDIEVLGTAFNVSTKENETVVSVDHGRVAVTNEKGTVELTIGESTSANSEGVADPKPADPNFDAWKTGTFVFDGMPLSAVLELLNDHYTTKIKLANDSKNDELYTGSWEDESIHTIIQSITKTCNVTADSSGAVIELR